MIAGIGFLEIIIVFTLALLFFGSKELPVFIREISRFIAKVRKYTSQIKREIDISAKLSDNDRPYGVDAVIEEKRELRIKLKKHIATQTIEDRIKKSEKIIQTFCESDTYRDANVIMTFCSIMGEVDTTLFIERIIKDGKRCVLPYCKEEFENLGIAAVTDLKTECSAGKYGIIEPKEYLRKNMLKSDLDCIICPCLGFDSMGGRLGRGMGYYDRFLKELKGRIPIIALAYDLQKLDSELPYDYHDTPVDMLITESGITQFT